MSFFAKEAVVAVSNLLRLHVLGSFLCAYALRRRQQHLHPTLKRSYMKTTATASSSRDGVLIIAPGLGRCGTVSLKIALEMLGFPTYHEISVMENLHRHRKFWEQAVKEGSGDGFWQRAEILQGYKAICGLPAARFYRELLVAYPHAKVILKVRDEEAWYNSVLHTLRQSRLDFWNQIVCKDIFDAMALFSRGLPAFGVLWDKTQSMEHFRCFIEGVKATVPVQQLLVHDMSDGWEPICRFLDVEMPSEPYPCANKSSDFHAPFQFVQACACGLLSFVVLALCMLAFHILGR